MGECQSYSPNRSDGETDRAQDRLAHSALGLHILSHQLPRPSQPWQCENPEQRYARRQYCPAARPPRHPIQHCCGRLLRSLCLDGISQQHLAQVFHSKSLDWPDYDQLGDCNPLYCCSLIVLWPVGGSILSRSRRGRVLSWCHHVCLFR